MWDQYLDGIVEMGERERAKAAGGEGLRYDNGRMSEGGEVGRWEEGGLIVSNWRNERKTAG